MRIEVTESGGIKCEAYGHMQLGEVRVVDEEFGRLAVSNGWAKHLPAEGEELIPCGERGKKDGKLIQPDKGTLGHAAAKR